jgi:hypothetical protein
LRFRPSRSTGEPRAPPAVCLHWRVSTSPAASLTPPSCLARAYRPSVEGAWATITRPARYYRLPAALSCSRRTASAAWTRRSRSASRRSCLCGRFAPRAPPARSVCASPPTTRIPPVRLRLLRTFPSFRLRAQGSFGLVVQATNHKCGVDEAIEKKNPFVLQARPTCASRPLRVRFPNPHHACLPWLWSTSSARIARASLLPAACATIIHPALDYHPRPRARVCLPTPHAPPLAACAPPPAACASRPPACTIPPQARTEEELPCSLSTTPHFCC